MRDVRRIRHGTYEVTGDVAYVTSTEIARGGAAQRNTFVATVVQSDNGEWQIAGYAEH